MNRRLLNKDSIPYVILSLSLMFGWLLSLPFHGPLLNIYCESRGMDPQQLATLFSEFNVAGMLLAGFLFPRKLSWKLLIRAASLVTLTAATALLFSPAKILPVLFACAGTASGIFILAWSIPFSLQVPPGRRIRIMALIIIGSNLVYLSVKLSLLFFMPEIGQFIALASLIGASASIFFMNPPEISIENDEAIPARFSASLLALLSGTIFILYISGGFMYQILYPSTPVSLPWLPIFRDLIYIAVLVFTAAFGPRIDRMLPVYASASLMVLAFGCNSLAGSSLAGMLGTEVLIHASMALLDLFLWTVLGDIAMHNKQPLRVFGLGISANLAGILSGGLIGEWLTSISETPEIILAISTGTAVSLTFLFIPFLAARFNSDLKE